MPHRLIVELGAAIVPNMLFSEREHARRGIDVARRGIADLVMVVMVVMVVKQGWDAV
jgi:hypothetical protein